MSWNQSEIERARETIIETARQILAEEVSPIEGARLIVACRMFARLESDRDILPFVGIDSETETLPLGKDRHHWRSGSLAELAPAIEAAQAWALKIAIRPCENLLQRAEELLFRG
ncbi:hypothetical protein [Bradyrhizobium oligotrophicum]|uniref:hypothetical protein n=1 Tax=Bradyrhizobium oligotrophicum TaxID=44255 RepID=UPI001181B666|nr:hypothetical protein [Bradyrhizobium oligotrophicum]